MPLGPPAGLDRPVTRPARWPAAAPVAAGALLLAGLAACGGGGVTASPAVLRSARARTLAAGSARLHASAVLTALDVHRARPVRMTEDGVIDFTRDATREIAVVSGTGRLQVIIIGRSWYQRAAGQRGWRRLRVADAVSQAGTTASGTAPLSPGDPSEILTYLSYPATTMVRVGREQVGGVPTTHYHAVLKNGDYGTIPADVWIDTHGRIRQAGITLLEPLPARTGASARPGAGPSRAPASGRRGSLRLTVAFSGFGVRTQVSPPPAAQVSGH